MKNVSDKTVRKIKTHVVLSLSFFFSSDNRAVYKITWTTMVERDRTDKNTVHLSQYLTNLMYKIALH